MCTLEAELQKVVSHLIGAGNQDLVLTTEPLPQALVLTSFFYTYSLKVGVVKEREKMACTYVAPQ